MLSSPQNSTQGYYWGHNDYWETFIYNQGYCPAEWEDGGAGGYRPLDYFRLHQLETLKRRNLDGTKRFLKLETGLFAHWRLGNQPENKSFDGTWFPFRLKNVLSSDGAAMQLKVIAKVCELVS